MTIRNVIFDLDGTLLDTGAGILESVKYTVSQLGITPLPESQYRAFIGPPLRRSFIDFCGCTEEAADRAVRVYRDYYRKDAILHAEPYDGIEALCEKLYSCGFLLGVATNKPQPFAVRLLRHFHLDAYIPHIFGADAAGTRSKADLVRLCLAEMGGAADNTVLVGDTCGDAAGAEQAGVLFAAVTYGYGFRSAADTAEYPCIGTADSPAQLWQILTADTL